VLRSLAILLVLYAAAACAQTPTPHGPDDAAPPSASPSDTTSASSSDLPDAPGEPLPQQETVVAVAEASFKNSGNGAAPCGIFKSMKIIYIDPAKAHEVRKPCSELIYPYQQFLNTNIAIPMTWQQKGYLALHELTDPANVGTILGVSAITLAIDQHTAYGAGWEGFGKIAGVSLLQDATGQFFGTFLLPSVFQQDPRYYRMPHASVPRRLLYSISRTVISRHDDGSSMPNYSTLLTYPISAEISNLYVPGIHSDAPSTTARILTGLATDPANNLLSEFLPDVAKRVHIRIIFVQRILNNVASGESLP
jgi:hypothetical protein